MTAYDNTPTGRPLTVGETLAALDAGHSLPTAPWATTARLSPQREAEMHPVGYYCDHSDEPIGARTHHDWEWVEGDGYVFQHQPDTISSHSSADQRYLKSEDRATRCARAVPVYAGPAVAAELAAVRAELAEAKRASLCQSEAAINGARCALPVRHRGDHENEKRTHFWSDEFAAETEVAS